MANQPNQPSDDVLGQLYGQAGTVGAMLDQVHAEMRELAQQLTARDEQLAKALIHAEESGDSSALEEIRREQAENAEAWQTLREHLGDELDGASGKLASG